jgi:hypothetical protein
MFTENENRLARNNAFDFSQMSSDDLKQTAAEISRLIASTGWQIVASQVQAQSAFRISGMIDQESGGIDGCVNREFTRGAISSSTFMLNFPQMLLNGIEQELEDRKKDEDHETQ